MRSLSLLIIANRKILSKSQIIDICYDSTWVSDFDAKSFLLASRYVLISQNFILVYLKSATISSTTSNCFKYQTFNWTILNWGCYCCLIVYFQKWWRIRIYYIKSWILFLVITIKKRLIYLKSILKSFRRKIRNAF